MCFNGHKLYQAGWYSGSSLIVDPVVDGPYQGRLVSFVDDVGNDNSATQIIKVQDYYVVYNRAKKHNFETQEKANLVTVTEDRTVSSEMLGGIESGGSLCVGGTVCIQVCGYHMDGDVDYVNICIFNPFQQEPCLCDNFDTPVNAPTSVQHPTVVSTIPPTAAPSIPLRVKGASQPPVLQFSAQLPFKANRGGSSDESENIPPTTPQGAPTVDESSQHRPPRNLLRKQE